MYTSLNPAMVGVKTDFAGAIQLAKRYGFQAIDLPIGEALALATATSVAAVRKQLSDAGLGLGPWGLTVDWRSDDDKFASGLAELPRYATFAQQLGAERASTWVLPGQNDRSIQEQHDHLLGRFRRIAAVLADHNIRLGLEFIGPKTLRDRFTNPFYYKAPDMLAFAREIGPNVGLLHDCFHWYTSGGTQQELAAMTNADIVSVHVNDARPGLTPDTQIDQERALPGEHGVIDINGYLRGLAAIGYDGPVTVEPFSARVRALPADEAVAATAAALQQVWKAAGIA